MWCSLWILWFWQIPVSFLFCHFHYFFFLFIFFLRSFQSTCYFQETLCGVTDLAWVCFVDTLWPGVWAVTLPAAALLTPRLVRSGIGLGCGWQSSPPRACSERRSRIKHMAYVIYVSKDEFLSQSVRLHTSPGIFSAFEYIPTEADSFTSKQFWDF